MNLSTTNWDKVKLGDILTLEYGKSLPEKERTPGDYRVFGSNGVVGYHEKALLHGPVIIVGRKGSVGSVRMTQDPCWPIDTTYWVKPKRSLSTKWLFEYLCHAKLNRLNEASGVPGLNRENAYRLNMPFPPIAEQERIAEILSDADAAITTMERLINAKESRFLLARQNQFLIDYKRKDFLKEVKKILTPVSERKRPDLPLLSTMQNMGVVRRDALARKVGMTANNTINHKVVCPGDFVVSLQSFKTGLEHSKITGLISPAYDVLRPTKPIIGDYFKYFFKSQGFIKRLALIAYGIRVGKQISFNSLGEMLVPCPPMNQQKKVAERLNALQKDITLERKVLAALKKQKRGLMQQLLTGKIRVLSKNNKGGKK